MYVYNKIFKNYKILLIKNALAPTLNSCRSEDSTTTLGSSFHNLVYGEFSGHGCKPAPLRRR